MDKPYKFFCLGNVLIDKGINYLYSEDKSDKKAIRMKNIDRGTFGSLYDLTYDSTKIIDRLYLGNSCNARNYYELENNNIGMIINSSPCISNYFENEFTYYNVKVEDISGADIYSHLTEVVDRMHNYIEENPQKNIFVHCFMGSSRSATIIIAYLIKYHNYGLREALSYVKEKREVVNLNQDFFKQLRQFEDELNISQED
jgi:protein phosphatase slingshot